VIDPLSMPPQFQKFLLQLQKSQKENNYILMLLGSYKGGEKDLRSCTIRPVLVRGNLQFQAVFRYTSRDVTKVWTSLELQSHVAARIGHSGFRDAVLQTKLGEFAVHVVTKDRWKWKQKLVTNAKEVSLEHNRVKERLIPESRPFLRGLGLTDNHGKVQAHSMDKFVQINRFVEMMAAPLATLQQKEIRLWDMGAGKGYVTFAMYDYLERVLGKMPKVTAVEQRAELVAQGNKLAQAVGFDHLTFRAESIDRARVEADVVIALHACDTATDDAIFHGIRGGAQVIAVAPCCHKEVRRAMAKKLPMEIALKTRFGILKEREAEMVTDALRALLLEYAGYQVTLADFVSDVHTPKNVLLLAVKNSQPLSAQKAKELWDQAEHFLAVYGLRTQRLFGLLEGWKRSA